MTGGLGQGMAAGLCPPQESRSLSPPGTSQLVQGTGCCLGASQLLSNNFLLIIWRERRKKKTK